MARSDLATCPHCGKRGLLIGQDRIMPRHRLPWRKLTELERAGFASWPHCLLSLHELTYEDVWAAALAQKVQGAR